MCNISKRLLDERKRLNKNQAQMAVIGGVAKRTYCNYESGDREPTTKFLTAIAAEGADVQYILIGVQGYIPQPPSVLETARKQDYIDAVNKAAYSNGKTDSVAVLGNSQNINNGKTDSESVLGKFGNYTNLDHDAKTIHNAAETKNGYNVQKQPISEDEMVLLNHYRACPVAVQQLVRKMAEVSRVISKEEG